MQGEEAAGILPRAERESHEGSGRKKGHCAEADLRNRDCDGSARAFLVLIVSV